jgi:hypothetical protein
MERRVGPLVCRLLRRHCPDSRKYLYKPFGKLSRQALLARGKHTYCLLLKPAHQSILSTLIHHQSHPLSKRSFNSYPEASALIQVL